MWKYREWYTVCVKISRSICKEEIINIVGILNIHSYNKDEVFISLTLLSHLTVDRVQYHVPSPSRVPILGLLDRCRKSENWWDNTRESSLRKKLFTACVDINSGIRDRHFTPIIADEFNLPDSIYFDVSRIINRWLFVWCDRQRSK